MGSDENLDADARPVKVREWDELVDVWKGVSELARDIWLEQATLAASIQQLARGATQRVRPTASDIEWGLRPIFETMEFNKAISDHAQIVQSFCIQARDAWSEVEEGRHRQRLLTATNTDLCRPSTPFPCDHIDQHDPELGSSCAFQAVCYAKRICSAFVFVHNPDVSL